MYLKVLVTLLCKHVEGDWDGKIQQESGSLILNSDLNI